jgi:hypothetical protein
MNYTGIWKLLYDWQTIIAGTLCYLAAVIGVFETGLCISSPLFDVDVIQLGAQQYSAGFVGRRK